MKLIKYSLIFIICFATLSKVRSQAISQLDEYVINKINTINDFNVLVDSVENYYEKQEDGRESKSYKHWARWAYYMGMHIDDRGQYKHDIEDKNWKAFNSFQSGNRSSEGNWTSLGPYSISHTYGSGIGIGRVDRIAFHPTNSNIFYIGTPAGGLFKTTNNGDTWQAMTDALPSMSISGIVVDHENPTTVYILTGDGDSNSGGFVKSAQYMRSGRGVFRSDDGGQNWKKLSDFSNNDPYVGYKLLQHPTNSNILFAATNIGIFKSENAGNSWIEVSAELTFDIEFKPGSTTIMYASHDGAVTRSTDTGNTWQPVSSSTFLRFDRIEIAVTPASTSNIYFFLWGFVL